MPGGDGSGPMGMGPMTGRAAGYCAGYQVPGFMNGVPGGFGYGRGRGFGRGMAWGRGLGRGFGRARWGIPTWGTAAPVPPPAYAPTMAPPDPKQELGALQNQAGYFQGALDDINQRIKELESQVEKKEA